MGADLGFNTVTAETFDRPFWRSGETRPRPRTDLAELVRRQAREHPDVVAVRQWSTTLTYAELYDRAAALAGALAAAGVRRGDRVVICAGRRPGWVTGALGVLIAGAAYVPVEPDAPALRRDAVVADAGADVVLVDAELGTAERAALAGSGRRLIDLDDPPASGDRPPPAAGPDDPAYVLYTSGSTGEPKGVVVPHEALVSFVYTLGEVFGLEVGSRSFGYNAFSYDVHVCDVWGPLAFGGTIALFPDDDRADPGRIERFCAEHEVTWGCVPPALLPALEPSRMPALRKVLTGGEASDPGQVARWSDPPGRVFRNWYGPTETTVAVTGNALTGQWTEPLPIGGPLTNHRVAILDPNGLPVPDGTPGELCVTGAGLAHGYLGSPRLTAERFVPDPAPERPGGRMYRTGDLAAWRPDGSIAFLGRLDGQVKIRGQRVEIGDVEAALRSAPDVAEAVVEAVPAPGGGSELAAFVILGDAEPNGHGPDLIDRRIAEHCALRVPADVVPRRIVRLTEWPLTRSAKIDRKALRERYAGPALADHAVRPPVTDVEHAVAACWTTVFDGAEAPSLDDDFFDCGGHSVTAMRLVAEIGRRLGRVLPVDDVFAARTLGRIAERVAAAPAGSTGELPRGSAPRLSAAQRRLWFLDQLAPDATAYNVAMAARLDGPLDVVALSRALAAVAARHDVLRWRVPHQAGTPYAAVDPPGPVDLPVHSLDSMVTDAAVTAELAADARRRFDLATGPLWRARLLRLTPETHVLSITAHHAVFDGWSQAVLYRDLQRAYRDERAGRTADLGPPEVTFADYATWREDRDATRGADDLAWWRQHLADAPAVLTIPADRPRPAEQSYTGELVPVPLGAGTDAAVRRLARRLGVTPSTVLLAAFTELLARASGQRDLVVGTPVADRGSTDMADLIGFFVEIVPLRVRPEATAPFADQVRACATTVLDALAHPSAPVERIVDALGLDRDPSRNPLVQVLFNVFNFAQPELELDGMRVSEVPPPPPGSPFDLTFYVVERDSRIAVDVLYATALFDRARIDALIDAFTALLEAFCADPERPVGEVVLPATPVDLTAPAVDAVRPARTPSAPAPAANGTPPVTPTEKAVAAVWHEVLGRAGFTPTFSVTDNFFDVGGTSMAIVTVRHRLAETLGNGNGADAVELEVVDLFRFPTIRSLAAHLDGAAAPTNPGAARAAARISARTAARRDRARRIAARHHRGGAR